MDSTLDIFVRESKTAQTEKLISELKELMYLAFDMGDEDMVSYYIRKIAALRDQVMP